jgi:hypothetical protein
MKEQEPAFYVSFMCQAGMMKEIIINYNLQYN